ncbi:hypothetical protein [Rubrimonas cliftonensis]|nr:hypothetical protein [Rubrimonas cliftonensis]
MGEMVALKSLRGANADLGQAQSAASSGLAISTARDNAAIWSVASVLRSDESWISGAMDSMALGGATVGMARQVAERATALLTDMKERIVLAQGRNVDRLKIDADIQTMKEALRDVINGADFNGFNLLEDARPDTLTIVTGATRSPAGLEVAALQVERRVMTPRVRRDDRGGRSGQRHPHSGRRLGA